MNHRYLQKFQIKDVVFLAIMSAVALATCAVMPLVISLQPLIFGISQLVTALQIGVFFAIGLYKVRKPGSLLIMVLMMGLIKLMMSPPMFLSSDLNGILIELIVLLLFRGYEKDGAVFVAAMLHTPLSLPFNYLYNRLIKGADSPLAAVADRAPLAAVGMTLPAILPSTSTRPSRTSVLTSRRDQRPVEAMSLSSRSFAIPVLLCFHFHFCAHPIILCPVWE